MFASELVGGWSSGTGLAGVGGAGLYLSFGLFISIRCAAACAE
jgi:hypothetical protein